MNNRTQVITFNHKKIDILNSIKVVHKTEISTPSASGIVKYNDSLLIIGDNSPYLYCFDLNGKFVSKQLIFEAITNEFGIIEKKWKPDFESMELVNEHQIYIFGSGSKSPERDVLVIVFLQENYRTEVVNLSSFYTEIKGLKEFAAIELNIEACTILNGRIFFFNRSGNLFFSFLMDDFNSIIFNEESFISPKIYQLRLPSIKGIEAGFSGATGVEASNQIIFTASVENTPNAYDDGEILGSFIGMIEFNDENEIESYSADPLMENDNFLKIKVESVCLNHISLADIELFLVTDNDGGSSQLMKLDFRL